MGQKLNLLLNLLQAIAKYRLKNKPGLLISLMTLFGLAIGLSVVISMFCTDEAEDDLRKILLDNINWNVEIEFAVSYLFSFF